jgi:hypothetical protein
VFVFYETYRRIVFVVLLYRCSFYCVPQLDSIKNLHPAEHSVRAAALRDAIKGTPCHDAISNSEDCMD